MRSLSFNFSIAFRMFSWNESTPAPDPVPAVAPDPEAVDAAGMKLQMLTPERHDILKSSGDTRQPLSEREESLDIISELEAKLVPVSRNW